MVLFPYPRFVVGQAETRQIPYTVDDPWTAKRFAFTFIVNCQVLELSARNSVSQ